MRTILVTILLWAFATIAFCIAGLWLTAKTLERRRPGGKDPVTSLVAMLGDDARRAFDEGGSAGLSTHLRQVAAKLPGERFLVDADGKDLVDGSDRTAILRAIGPGPARLADGRFAVTSQPDDAPYRFVWLVEPWFDLPSPTPFIAVVVAIIAFMGTALAFYLSRPLRHLRRAMDRFGSGDLQARTGSRRRDEIGVVSREFDLLAERIETLLTAERRLLQDVSHELRSPLTRLDVAVDLAIKREDRSPLLARIRRDISRLSELVGELLHLTRVEGDPSARRLDIVRPGDILSSLVEDCSLEAEAKGCRLQFHGESAERNEGRRRAAAPGLRECDQKCDPPRPRRDVGRRVARAMRAGGQGGGARLRPRRAQWVVILDLRAVFPGRRRSKPGKRRRRPWARDRPPRCRHSRWPHRRPQRPTGVVGRSGPAGILKARTRTSRTV